MVVYGVGNSASPYTFSAAVIFFHHPIGPAKLVAAWRWIVSWRDRFRSCDRSLMIKGRTPVRMNSKAAGDEHG